MAPVPTASPCPGPPGAGGCGFFTPCGRRRERSPAGGVVPGLGEDLAARLRGHLDVCFCTVGTLGFRPSGGVAPFSCCWWRDILFGGGTFDWIRLASPCSVHYAPSAPLARSEGRSYFFSSVAILLVMGT